MKNLTIKNLEKAKQLLIKKGYTKEQSENFAINAFAFYKLYGFLNATDFITSKY